MTRITIANPQARALFLQRQGLCDAPHKKQSKQDLLDLITRLGFVQVDSINTVERAHHMILFSRNQTYKREHLTELLEHDGTLFENWTHDASVIPSEFFRHWRHRFERDRERLRQRWRVWRRPGFEAILDDVLAHVRRDGRVMARHMGAQQPKANKSDGWWDWHPSKTALEFLWRTGQLAVAGRRNFQKIYDLTERVIPARYRRRPPSSASYIDWCCASALDRLGTATAGEIAAFWDGVTPAEAKAWCQQRLGKGLIEVLIAPADGAKPRPAYAHETLPDTLADLPSPSSARVRLLSPFDPLLRDRQRALRLFNFHYRIEVFVPAAKRHYGYYVFPLLQGDRLIGRIDLKHRRQEDNALHITGLWLEPGYGFTTKRRQSIDAELERLRRFITADKVSFSDGYLKTAG